MKETIQIVAISVDTASAVLYRTNGETVVIKQGDPRLAEIVETAKRELAISSVATINLDNDYEIKPEYQDTEKGTNGLIKFFRIARSAISRFLNTESPEEVDHKVAHVTPFTMGVLPTESKPEPAKPTNAEKVQMASDKLDTLVGMGAKTTDNDDFHKPLNEAKETIVAVNTETGAVIPDVQTLLPQMQAAGKLNDYAGFQKFFERLSAIVNERGHSVEDLMKFMRYGDLPIADDGSIIAYKRLTRNSNSDPHFVDVHSRKVKQMVGSFVFMRHGLVDPNRRQDCSNGLHVAALSYLGSFNGEITVIIKINPEDVFAVPQYSHNKMRVAGYHIIAELPEELRDHVNRGKSISNLPKGAEILNNVLRGNHIGITQTVEICNEHATKLNIVNLVAGDTTAEAEKVTQPTEIKNETVAVVLQEPNKTVDLSAPKIKATDLIKKPKAQKFESPKKTKKKSVSVATPKASKTNNLAEQAKHLLGELRNAVTHTQASKLATDLISFKTRSKKSWTYLGITADEVSFIMGSIRTTTNDKAEAIQEANKKAEKRKESARTSGRGGPASQIRELLDQAPLTANQYKAILLIKKKAKKGWSALGVTAVEQAEIEKHK